MDNNINMNYSNEMTSNIPENILYILQNLLLLRFELKKVIQSKLTYILPSFAGHQEKKQKN